MIPANKEIRHPVWTESEKQQITGISEEWGDSESNPTRMWKMS